MKALKSELAKQLMADPKARQELRQVPSASGQPSASHTFIVKNGASVERYAARVVPKAA
ncbi:MAG TPA: hypothetical protein VGM81_15005 [Burkholderiaceae bacterium]|jgi:hypothetical protein